MSSWSRRSLVCGGACRRTRALSAIINSRHSFQSSFKTTTPAVTRTIRQRQLSTQRRRKPRSLQSAHMRQTTTKDRMRHLVETNQLATAAHDSSLLKQFNQLYDVAQGRLSWVRNKIFENWNPDYLKETSSQATTSTSTRRPIKQGLIMDAQWWFWNLALALSPAILIGAYCEFRGQHRMHEYQKRLELEQMKEIMGEEFVQEYVKEMAETPRPSANNESSFFTRLWGMIQDLAAVLSGELPNKQNAEAEIKSRSKVREAEPKNTSQQASVVETPNASTVKEKELPPSVPKTPVSTTDPTMGQLLQRIEQLEDMVQEQQSRKDQDFKRQLDRLRQSGIQNRVEDQMIESWERRNAASRDAKTKEQAVKTQEETKIDSDDSCASVPWSSLALDNMKAIQERMQSALRRQKTMDVTPPPEASAESTENTNRVKQSGQQSVENTGVVVFSQAPTKEVVLETKKQQDPSSLNVSASAGNNQTGLEATGRKPWWKMW